jgi:hypothetical protein
MAQLCEAEMVRVEIAPWFIFKKSSNYDANFS